MDLKVEDIIGLIKEKKELSGISDSLIKETLLKKLPKNHELNIDKKTLKILIKEVRNELRTYSGRFQSSSRERAQLLANGEIDQLLMTHSSTKERFESYPQLRKIIAQLKVNSIMDLGCGLNPLALANKDIFYYASDIKEDELAIIKEYFKLNSFRGKTFVYDLRKGAEGLPEVDLVLMLKLLDVLEKKGHKLAEKIITELKCHYIMISFSTKTLSGKPMNHPQRGWIEQLLKRLNLSYQLIKTPYELFYLIQKNQKGQEQPAHQLQ